MLGYSAEFWLVHIQELTTWAKNHPKVLEETTGHFQKEVKTTKQKQKNTIHNEENTQSKEMDTEVIHMLELTEDIEMVVITIFHVFKNQTYESYEKDSNKTSYR